MIIHTYLKNIGLPVIIVLLSVFPLAGQRPARTEEVRVVAPFKPAVMDATKITENPQTDHTPVAKPEFTYNIIPRLTSIYFDLDPIPAARMRGEPLARLYNGHVRGGFGTYTTPFAELFYNSLRSDTYSMGLHLRHFSSSGTISGHGYSAFSDNLARLHGKRFIGTNQLEGGLSYERNLVHRYGFLPDVLSQNPALAPILEATTREDLQQIFNHFNAHVALGSHLTDSLQFMYQTRLEYHSLDALKDASEQNLRFTGSLGRGIELPWNFIDKAFLNLETDVDYYATRTQVDTSNTAVIKVKPTAHVKFGSGLEIEAGFALMVQSDTASYARMYPHLRFRAQLLENFLTMHGSITGGISRHSLSALVAQNPFINTSANLGFLNQRLEISGGLSSAFNDNVSLNFSVTHTDFHNFAFFVTDTAALLQNIFLTQFDDMQRLAVRGELITQWGRRFKAGLSVSIFDYNLQNELKPWNLPTTEVSLSARYNIQEKIILTADLFGRDATYARTFNPAGTQVVPVQLHDLHIDANLGIEYRLSPILSFFANFSNIGNQSLERWINYPSQKFRFLAGASLSF